MSLCNCDIGFLCEPCSNKTTAERMSEDLGITVKKAEDALKTGKFPGTDSCNDECKADCAHVEEGCEKCGVIGDLNDDLLCDDCTQSRAEYLADMMHDQMKEGD